MPVHTEARIAVARRQVDAPDGPGSSATV